MNLKTFLTLNAILFIPFGLGMLIMPTFIFEMIDVQLDSDGLLMANTVGSMLFSFGLICLAARNADEQTLALQAVLIGNFSFHAIDFFLTGKGAFTGVMNELGYMFSGMHLLFALGFLFFYLKMKSSTSIAVPQV